MSVWTDKECEHCFGFGLVFPTSDHSDEAELDLCPKCKGYGRVPKKVPTNGFNALIAAMMLSDGSAVRTRKQCQEEIEAF